MKEVSPIKDRLKEIVQISYNFLCNKIADGNICVHNEASLQMHLGVILKQVGHLYEFSKSDRFSVELETWREIEGTLKSKKGRARCDIQLKMENEHESHEVAIELKYFRRHINETITDNRFSILLDLENLEQYQVNNPDLLCFEIVYTDNENYTKIDNRSKIKITPTISGNDAPYVGRTIRLRKTYDSKWDSYYSKDGEYGHHFLMIDLNR